VFLPAYRQAGKNVTSTKSESKTLLKTDESVSGEREAVQTPTTEVVSYGKRIETK